MATQILALLVVEGAKPATAFLFALISRLQLSGTEMHKSSFQVSALVVL